MAPIRSTDRAVMAFRGRRLIDHPLLLAGAPDGRRPHIVEKRSDGRRPLRHGVVELERGEIRIAQQRGALRPQRQYFADHRSIVGLAGMLASGGKRGERLLAQTCVRGERQERLDQRARQRHDMLAVEASVARRTRGRVPEERRQARQRRLAVQHELVGVFVRQHVLSERRSQGRQPLSDFGQAGLIGVRQARAAAHHVGMEPVQETRVFRTERLARSHRIQPRQQSAVHADRGIVPVQLRGDLTLHRLHRVVGVGGGEVPEYVVDAAEKTAALLQRDRGVGERRGCDIGGDRLHLRGMRRHARLECGHVMLGADSAERRQAERAVEGPQQGVPIRLSFDIRHATRLFLK